MKLGNRWNSSAFRYFVRININFSFTFSFIGTQSPDAVNKLLQLSDSSHQIKSRPQSRSSNPGAAYNSNQLPVSSSASPIISSNAATNSAIGISSIGETNPQRYHQSTKLRETSKLSSESSSLNFRSNHGIPQRARSRSKSIDVTLIARIYSKFWFLGKVNSYNDSLKDGGGDSGRGSLNSTDNCKKRIDLEILDKN